MSQSEPSLNLFSIKFLSLSSTWDQEKRLPSHATLQAFLSLGFMSCKCKTGPGKILSKSSGPTDLMLSLGPQIDGGDGAS